VRAPELLIAAIFLWPLVVVGLALVLLVAAPLSVLLIEVIRHAPHP